MKKALVRTGQFFRVLDSDNNISLTHLAVMVGVFKLMTSTDSVDATGLVAMLGALANYSFKKKVAASTNPVHAVTSSLKKAAKRGPRKS